jgi:outer membrane receptor protein involved in Fe transport
MRRKKTDTGDTPMKLNSGLTVALLCAASSVALSSPAFAQAAQGVEAVTVTGSRVISDIANSPTPLTVVSADQIAATTPTNIPDGLNKLPVFFGSNSQRSSGGPANNAAGNILNLRNFGVSRTLVLLDGHRVAPSNFNGTVDTDVLPQMLVSRVDVVTGGASAVYGSDAVTGVVNFVLDNHFNGFKYTGNAGISNYGDAAEFQGGVAAGTDLFGGRGHIEGSLRYYHQDKVFMGARPYGSGGQAWSRAGAGTAASPYVNVQYGRLPLQARQGGIVNCACSANNTTFVSNGVLGPFNPGQTTPTSGLNNGGDGGGYFTTSSFQSSLRTAEGFGRFSYDIDDDTTAYVNVIASESGNLADWSASTINPGTGRGSIFYTDNAYLSSAAKAALQAGNAGNTFTMSTFFDNVGGGSALATGNDFQSGSVDRNLSVTTGASGKLFRNYTWDVYYTHGESRQEEYVPHNANVEKFLAGEDAVLNPAGQVVCHVSLTPQASLYPGCVPINPFGPNSLTQEQFNYFTDRTSYIATNIMDDVGASVVGEIPLLPAGPVKVALSGEARWNQLGVQSNFNPANLVDCTGLRLCVPVAALYDQQTTAPLSVSNNVYEFAGELNVPLLKGLPLIQSLDMNLAGRFTNYSTSGSVETWKVGLDYHVDDNVRFRGTASVDIRAPNLYDLYQPLTIRTAGFADKLTPGNFSITNKSQGNAALVPEVAHTYTAGVVLTPDFIPGLTASVDYYRINMSKAITSLSGSSADLQDICIASGGTSLYCSLVERPFPYTNTTIANFPTAFLTQSVNSAKVRTEGVDIEVNYDFDLADVIDKAPGSFSLRNLTSFQPHITTITYPGAPQNLTSMPKVRDTAFLTYHLDSWGFSVQDTWLSGFSRKTLPTQVFAQPDLAAFNTIDVSIDKQIFSDSNALDVYFSVQNITNDQPPLNPTTSSAPGLTYPVNNAENAMGRYFIIGVRGNL